MIGPRQGVFVSRFKPICGCRFLFWMKRLSGALNSPMFSKQGCRPGGWWHHVHSDLPSKKYCECLDSETLGPFRPTDNGQGIFSAVKVVSPSLMCYFELKLRQEKKRGALWFILEHSSPSLWNNFTPSTWTRNHRVCNRHNPDIYLPFSQRTDLCSQLCSELSRPEALNGPRVMSTGWASFGIQVVHLICLWTRGRIHFRLIEAQGQRSALAII